jgi:Lysophospholipase
MPPSDRSGWGELTERTATLIKMEQERNPGQITITCGESFGGCLALSLISRFPDLCDQLILVNPASSARQQIWLHSCSAFTKLLPVPLYNLSALGLCDLLIASLRVRKPMKRRLLFAMQSLGPQNAAWRLLLLRRFDVDDFALHRSPPSTLILVSGADYLLPSRSEASRLTGYFPGARILVLPQSGHACLLESQVNLLALLKSYAEEADWPLSYQAVGSGQSAVAFRSIWQLWCTP